MTKEDNKCNYCDTFGCKTLQFPKDQQKSKCFMFNQTDPTTCLPSGPANYVLSGRAHLQENPDLDSLKGESS